MYHDRLTASILEIRSGIDLPGSEHHPFCVALEALADGIADNFHRYGIDCDSIAASVGTRDGSLLARSSDTPQWAHRCYLQLPADQPRRGEILALALHHLTAARRALPQAQYEVELGGQRLVWNADVGFQVPG